MLTCRQISNKPVITSDGRILGKLASAIVDEDWVIPLFSIFIERGLAQKFHIRKPLFGGPKAFLEPKEVSALSDNVILKRKLLEMEEYLKEKGVGMEASRLLRRRVLGTDGYHFGELQDMVIDQAHWRISELFVEVRKKAADEMGFPMTLFGTCHAKVPVKRVETIKDSVLLSLGPDDFKEYIVKQKPRD